MYEFYVDDQEVRESLSEVVERRSGNTENMMEIVYQPQAKFRVQSVTHCSSSIPGEVMARVTGGKTFIVQ